jgi:hypothetical protein
MTIVVSPTKQEQTMKKLEKFIKAENDWRKIFGNSELSIDTPEGRQQVAQLIDIQLSPENLYCDGEISHAEAQMKYRMLSGAAKDLMKIDPNVVIYEI